MTITVRRAIEGDIPWLLGELKKFSEFFASRIPLFDEQESEPVIREFVMNHVVFVAVRKSTVPGTGVDIFHPVGFIGGALTNHFLRPSIRTLSEVFWWVDEKNRGTRAGILLRNEFVSFGKAHADWITMALEEASPVNERALTSQGFRLQERSYLLEVS